MKLESCLTRVFINVYIAIDHVNLYTDKDKMGKELLYLN
jgi:hypothetical protein